jgi:hypothetical protein
MRTIVGTALVLVSVLVGGPARADDLTGANRLLCASVQATVCYEDGECAIDLPWNVNIPAFIEVDFDAKSLSTTTASGLNRTTPIEHVDRRDGTIVLQGFEMGRAFSWIITEVTGQVTVAVAFDGAAVAVFGSCTPLAKTAESGGK